MTYLTRLTMNPRSRSVQRDLADIQNLHRSVMSAFPQATGSARQDFSILFRLDLRDGVPTLLVQSAAEPEWTSLPSGYLTAPPVVKRIDAAYESLGEGQCLVFRLRANPTKRLAEKGDGRSERLAGKRVDLRSEQERLEWLRRKAAQSGFELVSVKGGSDVPAVDTRSGGTVTGMRGSKDRGKLSFGAATFEGILRVVDPDRFRCTLLTGIGPGKAYGFGLLSIAPIPR